MVENKNVCSTRRFYGKWIESRKKRLAGKMKAALPLSNIDDVSCTEYENAFCCSATL
jgi:hypothetical protein